MPEPPAPELSTDLDPRELDTTVRAQLSSLSRPVAGAVARHLVATGHLLDDDPDKALAHALAARRLASRVSAVREAAGLAAYRAGQWTTAVAELRAYHRMAGNQAHLAILADCERALGRPERAIDLYRTAERSTFDRATAVELLIVAAGARGDLGQRDAAVSMLQVRELTAETTEPWLARLRYAYADSLLAAGREDEAREWFVRAAEVDEEAQTDAAERLLEIDGIALEEDEDDDETARTGAGDPDADVADQDDDLDDDDDLDSDDDEDDDELDEDEDKDDDLDEDEDDDELDEDEDKDDDLHDEDKDEDDKEDEDDEGDDKDDEGR